MTGSNNLQLALVVDDQEGLELYVKRFGYANITFHPYRSIQSFMLAPKKENSYSGIVIDMKTALRSTPVERNFLQDVLETLMPVGKFTRPSVPADAVAEKIQQAQWEAFLKECEAFNPRGLRTYPRKNCVLKVQVCLSPVWVPERSFKTVTADISAGGCFVVASDAWNKGTVMTMLLGDAKEPIVVKVAWERPWGASLWYMPGAGVEFQNLSAVQRTAIYKILEIVSKGDAG